MERKLSRADKKLLQAALESGQNSRLTMDEIAEKTGRSVSYVYERLQDPEFKAMFMESMRVSMVAESPAILQKFAELAKEGSFKHGKLVLELSGLYAEESKLTVDAHVASVESPFGSDEEKADFLRATLSKHLEKSGTKETKEGEG